MCVSIRSTAALWCVDGAASNAMTGAWSSVIGM
jgi:hypothetical protein